MEKGQKNKVIPLILVVDDVETNRFVLRDIIAEMGCRPVLTENGLQALKLVERHKPQLIVLDVAMPEMDGYEFCRIMKENANTRDIPIIFISAFDDPTDVVKGFNLGGEDYITKPFIPEVVKARIGIHLKLSETSKNLADMNRKLQTSISKQLSQMEQEKKNVLYTLLRVVQENAGYDKMQMERLSYNARILGEAMQLSPKYGNLISDKYIETLELAAPLYEWGNVAILSDIMKVEGYNEFIQMAIDIVESKEEKWDGSGQPNSKRGEEIPLSTQIMVVAGTYCGLTTRSTSDKEYNIEEIFEIMQKEAGVKFNPDVFAIFRKIYRQLK